MIQLWFHVIQNICFQLSLAGQNALKFEPKWRFSSKEMHLKSRRQIWIPLISVPMFWYTLDILVTQSYEQLKSILQSLFLLFCRIIDKLLSFGLDVTQYLSNANFFVSIYAVTHFRHLWGDILGYILWNWPPNYTYSYSWYTVGNDRGWESCWVYRPQYSHFPILPRKSAGSQCFCEGWRASHCHSPQTTYSSKSTCCVLSVQKSATYVVYVILCW